MRGSQALLAILALSLVPLPAQAQRARWITLNATSVRTGVASETIWVRNRRGLVEARLCVERRSIRVTGARIDFDSGRSQRIGVRRTIRPGECSRPVRLRDGGRDRIRSVRLSLARLSPGIRPFIRLQAR